MTGRKPTFLLAWVRCSHSCWRATITPTMEVYVHKDGLVAFNVERRVCDCASIRAQCFPVSVSQRSATFVVVGSVLRAWPVANMAATRGAAESLLVGLGWKPMRGAA